MAEPRTRGPWSLALLDFDGTLADSFPWFLEVLDGVAERFSFRKVAPGEVEDFRGLPAREIIARLGIPGWKLPLIARHMHQLQARDAARINTFPGLDVVLPALCDRGLTLCVVTSNAEENVRRTLGPGLTGLVDHFACGRPLFGKASAFRKMLRVTGVPANEAIVVGDELRDAHAARQAGLAFAAVSWGYTRRDALAAAGPALMVDRVEDLLQLAAGD